MKQNSQFSRGARVRNAQPDENSLSVTEAFFAACILAEKAGSTTEEQFLALARRTWRSYVQAGAQGQISAPAATPESSEKQRFTAERGSLGVVKVHDEDFGYDAALSLSGDFPSDEEKLAYAFAVAAALNQAQLPRRSISTD